MAAKHSFLLEISDQLLVLCFSVKFLFRTGSLGKDLSPSLPEHSEGFEMTAAVFFVIPESFGKTQG
jgi:hypothetical protein